MATLYTLADAENFFAGRTQASSEMGANQPTGGPFTLEYSEDGSSANLVNANGELVTIIRERRDPEGNLTVGGSLEEQVVAIANAGLAKDEQWDYFYKTYPDWDNTIHGWPKKDWDTEYPDWEMVEYQHRQADEIGHGTREEAQAEADLLGGGLVPTWSERDQRFILSAPPEESDAVNEWAPYLDEPGRLKAQGEAEANTAYTGVKWVEYPTSTQWGTLWQAVEESTLDLPEEQALTGMSEQRGFAEAERMTTFHEGDWEAYQTDPLDPNSWAVRRKVEEEFRGDPKEVADQKALEAGPDYESVLSPTTGLWFVARKAPQTVDGQIEQYILDGRIDEAFKLNEIRNRLNTKKISREEAARMVANVAQTPQEFDTWISALVDEDRWLTDTPEVIRRAGAAVPERVQFEAGMAVPRAEEAGVVQPPTVVDTTAAIVDPNYVDPNLQQMHAPRPDSKYPIETAGYTNPMAATVGTPLNLAMGTEYGTGVLNPTTTVTRGDMLGYKGVAPSNGNMGNISQPQQRFIPGAEEVVVEPPDGPFKVRRAQGGGKVLNAGLVYVDPGEDIIPSRAQEIQRDPSRYTGDLDIAEHQAMSGFRQRREARDRGVVPIPGSQIMGGGATFAGSPYRTYASTADRLAALPEHWSRSKRAQFDVGQAQQIQARQQAFRQRRPRVRLFR